MRMVIIKEATSAEQLGERVLSPDLTADKRRVALEQIRKLNPHADVQNVEAGAVLFVPDSPDFKAAETESIFDDFFGGFEKLMKSALDAVNDKAKAGAEARVAEGEELTRTLNSAEFTRLAESDAELRREADAAVATVTRQTEEATRAQEIVGTATKGALAFVRNLGTRINPVR